MLRIIDEEKNVDMTAKFKLGQEVCTTSFQGYRKGVVTGISAQETDKGVALLYTIELYVGKKSAPKIKKCLEKHVYHTPKDALNALAERAEKQESVNEKSNPETPERA